ncbi:MAG TPA: metallophosphoesterase family protein [Saprospiraceae bacterium]|nr:metallophosphoesterase family protein [Saprospiraceae bacterium]HPN68872.1 metallophosphoesterase family protein [Saprospiraceae bacterium]
MHIALISDNHSYIGQDILDQIADVDEIWHAGDIGSFDSIEEMRKIKPFRAVYGNIDDASMRAEYKEDLIWTCEGIKVYMTHIGGYPGRYNARASKIIKSEKPNLFICGHSHICKVLPDHKNDLLHMNPGAYGFHGFHQIRTILKFEIAEAKIKNLRAVELGLRGKGSV